MKYLPHMAGIVAGMAFAPLAFATTYTMTGVTVPGTFTADIIAAGSAGTTFSLAVIAGTVGAVLILGIVGWVLVKLSSVMGAALHIGRK